jgi:hypothetical protein
MSSSRFGLWLTAVPTAAYVSHLRRVIIEFSIWLHEFADLLERIWNVDRVTSRPNEAGVMAGVSITQPLDTGDPDEVAAVAAVINVDKGADASNTHGSPPISEQHTLTRRLKRI